MKTTANFSAQPALKTYIFGSLALYRNEQKHTYCLLRVNTPRLALVAGVACLICYALLVSAGYLWLREVRKIDQVGFMEVALIRVGKIRHEMAAQQFAKAQVALAAKDFSVAFVDLSSGLHNDPDNVAGRLQTAGFLQAAGATDRAVNLLEEGLARTPDNKVLLEKPRSIFSPRRGAMARPSNCCAGSSHRSSPARTEHCSGRMKSSRR